jgi:hypothetical protein
MAQRLVRVFQDYPFVLSISPWVVTHFPWIAGSHDIKTIIMDVTERNRNEKANIPARKDMAFGNMLIPPYHFYYK